MQERIHCRHCFAAIVMISAAMTGAIPNASAAFTSGVAPADFACTPVVLSAASDKTPANFYLNTPSIHQSVMDELIRGEREHAHPGDDVRGTTGEESSAAQGQAPTSMLWPAYKYLPQIGRSFTA
jgi:hypothetical protein